MEHCTEKQGCPRKNDGAGALGGIQLYGCSIAGWGGYVPSAAYFVTVHLQVSESRQDHMRRSLQMIDAQIIAGDSSLQVPKIIRVALGAQCKKFLYTLMNGHGQIVGFWFVDQDSVEQLKPFFDAAQRRWDLHGHDGWPLIAYGDNCCGKDRGTFKASFPSLKGSAP